MTKIKKDKKDKITISVKSTYLAEESSPENYRFLWSYDIVIKNNTDELVQLLNRHWRITDMRGKVEDVRGPGVVGMQPLIKPGTEFAYTSFCQLPTPQGTMEGDYELQNLAEQRFVAAIPKFVLACPIAADNPYRPHLH